MVIFYRSDKYSLKINGAEIPGEFTSWELVGIIDRMESTERQSAEVRMLGENEWVPIDALPFVAQMSDDSFIPFTVP